MRSTAGASAHYQHMGIMVCTKRSEKLTCNGNKAQVTHTKFPHNGAFHMRVPRRG